MSAEHAETRPILLLATTNPGKLREIRELLAGVPYDVRSLDGITSVPAPDESGETFEANALLKARYYAQATGLLAVADDSGLEIDAMDGRPGVLSARYPGDTYEARFVNIWREMAASGRPERTARFVCAIALATPSAVLFETRGNRRHFSLRLFLGDAWLKPRNHSQKVRTALVRDWLLSGSVPCDRGP